jgi:hypothetical protein
VFGQTNPEMTLTNGAVVLHFAGTPGYRYTVQRSADFLAWTDLGTTNAPANGLFQFTDNNPSQPAAFYRLQWNP